MNLENLAYLVRKHGEHTVQQLGEAQRLEAYANDEHGYSFGITKTIAGYKISDLDA